jgi:histidine triad (HIT) family protein
MLAALAPVTSFRARREMFSAGPKAGASGVSLRCRVPRPCLFCQIARAGVPAHVVLETPELLAFLDHRPLFKGHTLLVPRAHIETLDDLPRELLPAFFGAAQRISRALQGALGVGGTFVAINNRVSQSVPHLHCHIVPRTKGDGLKGFFWPRGKYESEEEMARIAANIRSALVDV